MFDTLGSDLMLFVSLLAEETNEIVGAVKDGLIEQGELHPESSTEYDDNPMSVIRFDSEDEEIECNNNIKEITPSKSTSTLLNDPMTYLEPLLYREVQVSTIPLHLANQDDCNEEEVITVKEYIHPEGSSERYEIENFINDFNIEERTEDIVKVLTEHPDTVYVQFHLFVPYKVTYKDFWMRYFYRCEHHHQQQREPSYYNNLDDCTDDDDDKFISLKNNMSLKSPASPSSVVRATLDMNLDSHTAEGINSCSETWF